MNVLLVNPPAGKQTIGLKDIAQVEPLGLEILGAAVADHQVMVFDMQIDQNLEDALQEFRPDVVGASAQIVQTYTAQHVLKTAKEFNPNILTLLGGHHATLCPHEFNAPYIDAVVLGEGVPAFQEIVERHRQGRDFRDVSGLALPSADQVRFTPARPLPTTLDHHPLPNRGLTASYRSRYFYLFESPVAMIQTSLGCTFPCSFCSCQKFTRRHFIPHSPEYIIQDLLQIPEPFVMFCDDHSFIDVKRMNRLHDLIVEHGIKKRFFAYTRTDCVAQNPDLFKKWAQIGLELVMTGLEAIDDANIGMVNKRTTIEMNEQAIQVLEKCGIGISAGFLIMPSYQEQDFKRIDAYVRARPSIVLTELTPLTPLPGTDLHAEQQGNAITTHNREVYDLAHFVVPTALPPQIMYGLMRKYYLRVVWRAIGRLKLYRPRYVLKRHLPGLIAGVFRTAWKLGHAHEVAENAGGQ
jgi:hopanoid C-3 methylase